MSKRKFLTLCIPVKNGSVLLGMKKRGFGEGKWNGFGGKVEAGETIEEAAKRETKEECGIAITAMEEAGVHEFRTHDKPDEILEVHVFRVTEYLWEPIETEEMRPEWFLVEKIPFDLMWPDDRHWFPWFLAKRKFRGKFLFGEGESILEQEILDF